MIGNMITEIRKELKIPSNELAKKVKVSAALLSLFENEKRYPSLQQLVQILYHMANLKSDFFFEQENEFESWKKKYQQSMIKEDKGDQLDKIDLKLYWSLNDFRKAIMKACDDHVDQMPEKERNLYKQLAVTSTTKMIDMMVESDDVIHLAQLINSEESKHKKIIISLSDLLHQNVFLELDEEELSHREIMRLKDEIFFFRAKRQERKEREERREHREREAFKRNRGCQTRR